MQTFRKRRAGLSATAGLSCSNVNSGKPVSKSKLLAVVVAELFTGQMPILSCNHLRQSIEG